MSTRQLTTSWGVASLVLALLVAVAALNGGLDGLDETLKPLVVHDGFWHGLARFVEELFEVYPMIAINVVLVLGLAFKGYRRAAIYVAGVNLVAAAVNPLLKHLIGRARPEWQDTAAMYLSDRSMPSGHVLHAVVLFGTGIVFARMFIRKAGLRRTAIALCGVMIAIVSLDRLLLGRHYLSDIIVGALIGAAVVLLGWALFSPVPTLQAVLDPEKAAHGNGEVRHCAVVLNPIKVESVEFFQTTVREIAAISGWAAPTFYLTTVEDSGTGQARQAVADGAELVLVCGGDGTVREVCAEMASTGIPVGVIPAGTGNLLARNLEIPLYLRGAIDVAFTGNNREIDMVKVSGDRMDTSHFLVMAGMGFDAAIMEGVSEQIKARVGWLAYVISGTKALMFPAVKVEISVDGGEFTKHRARTIVVGNVGTLTAGMPLMPDATIDDGLLDVVLLHPHRFWSWIPLAFRILAKRPHVDDLVNRWTGRELVIRAESDTPRQLDGDTVGAGRELVMTNVHRQLIVRVPR